MYFESIDVCATSETEFEATLSNLVRAHGGSEFTEDRLRSICKYRPVTINPFADLGPEDLTNLPSFGSAGVLSSIEEMFQRVGGPVIDSNFSLLGMGSAGDLDEALEEARREVEQRKGLESLGAGTVVLWPSTRDTAPKDLEAKLEAAASTVEFVTPNFREIPLDVALEAREEEEAISAFRRMIDRTAERSNESTAEEIGEALKEAFANVAFEKYRDLEIEKKNFWSTNTVRFIFSLAPGFGPFQTTAEAVPDAMRISEQRHNLRWMEICVRFRDAGAQKNTSEDA